MKVIRVEARVFAHLLPVILEQEAKGFKFLYAQDDGSTRDRAMVLLTQCAFFDDGKPEVSFDDRTPNC